jgi:O-antigen/teichoic acid export membrane protein
MNVEDLSAVWQSPRNVPDPSVIEAHRSELAQRLGKEYRDFVWHISMAVGLTLFLAGGFVQYLRSGGAFDWGQEWGSVVFLLLPVGLAMLFVRGFVRHRQRHPRYDVSILQALKAALDANRLSRWRLRVSMTVTTLAMAMVPLITHQLQLVGKQRPHEAMSMLAVFGVGYLIAMVCQVWTYRGKLAAERARLSELLESYERQ